MITYTVYKDCRSADERLQGMQNDMLEHGQCCMFVFDGRVQPRFWGKNTLQDLYVTLIDGEQVIDCQCIHSFDLNPVILKGFGDKAIETLDKIDIGARAVFTGDRVTIY